nr:PD40 domain-containing protein [Bacteroidota bacterium]
MKRISIVLIFLMSILLHSFAQDEARIMRFPTIHGNQVVFSYAGDLFSMDLEGGAARKLTNHVGYEMFARFSPDGKQIAFTAEYDGNREVYVIPSEGGVPKRLTFTATISRDDISDRMGPNNIVMCWKDNETIIFRSRMKSFNPFVGNIMEVNVQGGIAKELPVPRGGFCSFSGDGKKMAYNRVFREFRTWKYYSGGMADDVWIYDFNSKSTESITNTKTQ